MTKIRSGMVDVGPKKKTERMAVAKVFVRLGPALVEKIEDNAIPKGNVIEAARIAGIMGAKKTSEIIPLCHNIEIECVNMEFNLTEDGLLIESRVKTRAKTGVEMEAMVACSTAALTVYDMCKMFSKSIEITELCLVEKRGGRSGVYKRS
ncbi:MAG: cyclic pyranopterin monophosphate synthase MoaC [Candidatus Omnitrophica bacterium]|nr:cyclic pyranopterin monophosphate synthase MoaC [Candidatus Omnitrophota bacterium]